MPHVTLKMGLYSGKECEKIPPYRTVFRGVSPVDTKSTSQGVVEQAPSLSSWGFFFV